MRRNKKKLTKSGEYILICAAFVWISVAALAGCSPACAVEQVTPEPTAVITPTPEPTPVTLRVYTGVEGSTLDPAYLPETDPGDYMGHLFEGLMKYAPKETEAAVGDLEVVPGLAEKIDVSEGGLVYRFTLREDALWSDGRPVTAGDFVYAWQRVLDVRRSPGAAVLGAITEGFHAESDRVFAVQLRRVCPWFLKVCAAHYTVPVRQDGVVQYGGDWTDERNIVVTGPYTIREWVHDDVMVLVPNPHYYDRESIGPQVLEWRFHPQPGEHVSARQGEKGTYMLYFNTGSIRDWRVRAAMLLAIDRDALGQPAAGLVPAGSGERMYAWLAERYPRYDVSCLEGRRALARDLMDIARAAGTWHSGYKVYYRVTGDPRHSEIARQCLEDWREVLGVHGALVETPAEEYGQVLSSMRYDIAFMECAPEYDDPMAYLQLLERGGPENHTGWGDVRYDDLLERAEKTMDAGERNGLLREAEQFLFREEGFAVCPLLWPEAEYEVSGVTGIGYHGGEWRFQYANAY